MDASIARGLNDKLYEKRKAAALELEKLVRDCHVQGDSNRINQIIDHLVELFASPLQPLHCRNGGLIGLAATAIALGFEISPYMEKFIEPLLRCFHDTESRIRYFACESLYNIAKVSKGEILVYFNPIFDALSKLAADSELSVKNGAELLDRLLKDIVAESAPIHFPHYPETEKIRARNYEVAQGLGITVPEKEEGVDGYDEYPPHKKAFSLAHFIPLLAERIYVVSPFTRSYLVSWIQVLDSVPDLELVTFLPDFLDGLLRYLSDPIEDVRVSTENLLAEFLQEVRDIAIAQKRREEKLRAQKEQEALVAQEKAGSRSLSDQEPLPDITVVQSDKAAFIRGDDASGNEDTEPDGTDAGDDTQDRDTGAWIPGQGVMVNHAAIVEILIRQLDSPHDEIQQSTALRWIAEFLDFVPNVMVPFTPRLIPAILPNLAHHVPDMQTAANETNQTLFALIQSLPAPSTAMSAPPSVAGSAGVPPTGNDQNSSQEQSRSHSPTGNVQLQSSPVSTVPVEELDPFDYPATVSALTVQFLSEHEETRVAALKWLLMLHQKAPKKILSMDDGTFPVLLKTLSDPSEEVIKHDLQLLAQISSSSEEGYFKAFMYNLLEIFSTDRRLLDTRGSLIIRQLCMSLNTERIYRSLAEILEKEEDLEFASIMVQKLNIILITSPELAEFRKRLKNLESKDGQLLFSILYRSWCHNAVAVLSLCLLAQAYEHASNLLQIFADLEITVQLLVQIDKLVQLIESPVFTCEDLRLQLLEPEKYPFLFKCLYGLLMLLPQSSAFMSLRNRLNAVSSLGYLHIAPRSAVAVGTLTTRSKIVRDEIKWLELMSHFRSVQLKHEKSRRTGGGGDAGSTSGFSVNGEAHNAGGLGPGVGQRSFNQHGLAYRDFPTSTRSLPDYSPLGRTLDPAIYPGFAASFCNSPLAPSPSTMVAILTDWPLRKNFQQKYDATGHLIWEDDLTFALLTGAHIFPPHCPPTTRSGSKYGRNETLCLYVLHKTGVYRSPRQCGSKLQHLFTSEDIRKAMDSRPGVDDATREAVLLEILPLLSTSRKLAASEGNPTSPSERKAPPRTKPYNGPSPLSIRLSYDTVSIRHNFIGSSRTSSPITDETNLPWGFSIGPVAAVLAGLPSYAPVLATHIVLPPAIDVTTWSGISAELLVPGANNIEYDTFAFIANAPAPENRVKALAMPGAAFMFPVAPGFLTDILKVWVDDSQRRQLVPDITIIQRFRARKKGGKMSRDDFLAIVYTLEMAETPHDVTASFRTVPKDLLKSTPTTSSTCSPDSSILAFPNPHYSHDTFSYSPDVSHYPSIEPSTPLPHPAPPVWFEVELKMPKPVRKPSFPTFEWYTDQNGEH
ncbi:hypothetical protein FRB99_006354 [Tulasnella sp. 403]|nr:hypothetical protein FRB99_006354 [Tulasnella sp. 403]